MIQPIGPISLPLANLQSAIAHSVFWQTWVGGANGRATFDQSLARLFLIEPTGPDGAAYSPEELQQLRPYGVINLFVPPSPHTGVFDPTRIGLNTYRFTDHLTLELEDNVPGEDANFPRDAMLRFLNNCGQLIESVLSTAGGGGFLTEAEIAAGLGEILIRRASIWEVPQRVAAESEEAQGDHCRGSFLFDVGT